MEHEIMWSPIGAPQEDAPTEKRGNMEISKRDLEIYKMRKKGKTYREIGELFGISGSRASDIVEHIGRLKNIEKRYGKWLAQFDNTRIIHALAKADIFNQQQLYDRVSENGNIRLIGAKYLEIINEKIDRKICIDHTGALQFEDEA